MKGLPDNVDGPLGPWLKKVREAVASVGVGDSRERVIERLGLPDEVRHDSVSAAGALQGLLDDVAGGRTLIGYGDNVPIPEILVYIDPYRPRRRYLFGIRAGIVDSTWQETQTLE